MLNENGDKHEILFKFMGWLGGILLFLFKFFLTRYYDRKEKDEVKKRERELEKLLREDLEEHHKTKSNTADD